MVNPMLLLEANPYHSVQEVEKEAGISKMEVGFSIPNFTKEDRVERNSQDIFLKVQTIKSISKVNNKFNKGKQLLFDKLVQQDDMSLNEVVKLNLAYVDMDCANIVSFTLVARSFDKVL